MRVQCNQCGRMFEVAQSQANRALKCICKNIFMATPLLEEIKDPSGQKPMPPSSKNETLTQEPIAESEPSLEATVTAVAASEEELNDYISFLKVARKQNEPEKTDTPSPMQVMPPSEFPSPAEINTAWSKTNSLFDSIPETIDEPVATANSAEQSAAEEAPPEVAQSKITNIQRKEPQKVKTLPPEINQQKKMIIWGAGAVVAIILISILSFSVTKNSVREEQMDPYLSKLLSQPSKTPAQPAEEKKAPVETIPVQVPTPVAKTEAPVKMQTDIEESALYKKFIVGEFEDLVRLANQKNNLSNVDRALLLEALAQRADNDHQRLFKLLDDVKAYRNASNNDPNLVRSEAAVRIFLATTEADLTKPIETLKSLSRTQPHDALVFAYLGFGLHRLDRGDIADTAWDQAIAIEPDFFWLLQTRKELFIKSKQWDLAEKTAEKISQIEGYQVYGYREISRIASLHGKTEKGIDYLRKAAQLSPSSAIYISLGKLLKEKDFLSAIQSYEKALKLKPSKAETAEASISLARLMCENKMGDQASAYFRTHLTVNTSKSVIIEKAECEADHGLLARAANTFESGLKLDPRDSNMWYRYGDILYKNQKTRAALEAAQTSLKLRETESAHILAARVLLKLQNKKEAQKHIRIVLKSNPQQREASTLLKALN